MTPMPLLLLAAAAVGVDTGWTPLETGGYEYIIQIPAEQLDALRSGGEFGSDFPMDTGAIRSFRIVIGDGPVTNQGIELPPEARTNFKPSVEDTGASRRDSGSRLQLPPEGAAQKWRATESTANAVQTPRAAPFSGFGPPDRSTSDRDGAKNQTEVDNEPFEDIDLIRDSRGSRSSFAELPDPPADDATTPVDTQKLSTDEAEVGPSDHNDKPLAKANEPETWSRSKFQWTLLVLGLIFFGGLNGYLGWLALDFRNRYLELLRDLDTQPPDDSMEELRGRVASDEEDETEEDSPRELVRTAETYVGRKDTQHRRDRDTGRYDEE